MNGITFNNVHNSSISGLEYISSNRFIMPERKDQYIEIPFMDGAYFIPDNSKKDIEIVVNFTLKANSVAELFLRFIEVQNWLYTDDRKQLIFDDVPDYCYKAKVVGSVILQQVEEFEEVGEFTVTFRCHPQLLEVTP